MKGIYALLLVVLLSAALVDMRLVLPNINRSVIEPPSRTEGETNVCHQTLLKAAWKLADIVKHWATNWLLLFSDAKDVCYLLKEVVWNCFL